MSYHLNSFSHNSQVYTFQGYHFTFYSWDFCPLATVSDFTELIILSIAKQVRVNPPFCPKKQREKTNKRQKQKQISNSFQVDSLVPTQNYAVCSANS